MIRRRVSLTIALFVLHLLVYYMSAYMSVPSWLQYVDILGLYLNYGSKGIAGSVQQLFNTIFGLGISGWMMF